MEQEPGADDSGDPETTAATPSAVDGADGAIPVTEGTAAAVIEDVVAHAEGRPSGAAALDGAAGPVTSVGGAVHDAADEVSSAAPAVSAAATEVAASADEMGAAADELTAAAPDVAAAADEMGAAAPDVAAAADEVDAAAAEVAAAVTEVTGAVPASSASTAGGVAARLDPAKPVPIVAPEGRSVQAAKARTWPTRLAALIGLDLDDRGWAERDVATWALVASASLSCLGAVMFGLQGMIGVAAFFLAFSLVPVWLLIVELGLDITPGALREPARDRIIGQILIAEERGVEDFVHGRYTKAVKRLKTARRLTRWLLRVMARELRGNEGLRASIGAMEQRVQHHDRMVRKGEYVQRASALILEERLWLRTEANDLENTLANRRVIQRRRTAVIDLSKEGVQYSEVRQLLTAADDLAARLSQLELDLESGVAKAPTMLDEDDLPDASVMITRDSHTVTWTPSSPLRGFARRAPLGSGGMAEVYQAIEESTGRVVVWKQSHDWNNSLLVANHKLLRETQILQRAEGCPRVPGYVGKGSMTDGNGRLHEVLLQTYIEGPTLREVVEQHAATGQVIETRHALDWMLAICEPLEHLAALEPAVYHRDLKPQNVIIHPREGPYLIDFGLAKQVSTGEDVSITHSESGRWTAPERREGRSGPWTDVFSLGQLLAFVLLGEQPAYVHAEAPLREALAARGHPGWLVDVIRVATHPLAEDRVPTVTAFRHLLEHEGLMPEGGWAPTDEQSIIHAPMAADDLTVWGTTGAPTIHLNPAPGGPEPPRRPSDPPLQSPPADRNP